MSRLDAGASTSTGNPSDWVLDPAHGVYYHTPSQLFAIPNAAGEWEYVPVSDSRRGESSSSTLPAQDKEDGEVDDDVGWGGLMEPTEVERIQRSTYSDPKLYAYRANTPPAATPKHILRLVVEESSVLPKGGMVMIDAREGGIHLGRDRVEGQARVRIKEMEISKTHAVVYWGEGPDRTEEKEEGWWIVDLGSTHGTFLSRDASDHRLSEAKNSSLPHRLSHLTSITIGQTTFVSHIHPSWPCEACQLKGENEIKLDDGAPVVEAETAPVFSGHGGRELREMKRKREMAALKENLLDETLPTERREYQDRAAMRRRFQGGYSHPTVRSASPPPQSLPTPQVAPVNSFAMGMLANQGWVQGQGLGKAGTGRAEPVAVEMRAEKKGLGAAGSKAVPIEGDWRARGKERRYNELRN